MKLNRKYERGQALILIALAIVGMIGLVALAIDGGNVFSNRRSAQNAADAAALAGALARVKNPDLPPADLSALAKAAALARALSNNFTNDASNTVAVNNPPVAGCSGTNGPYAGNAEYIQVIIRTTVSTYFAPVVGINELHNCVEAIARAKKAEPVSLCYGALICGLDTGTTKTDDGKDTLRVFGGAEITLKGAGAFSNSDHEDQALYIAASPKRIPLPFSLILDPPYIDSNNVMVVGGYKVPDGYLPIPVPKTQLKYPLPDVMIPKYTCNYTLHDLPQDLPGGLPYLASGVYCVTGDFNKADYTNGKTDGENIGGVTIVMLNNGFTWQSNITLNAPIDCNQIPKPPEPDPFCNSPHPTPQTAGLLVYVPYLDPTKPPVNPLRAVSFVGGGDLNIAGTILAPDSQVNYLGNYATSTIKSQLIGWIFKFGGSANGNIYYPPDIFKWPGIASVELVK